MVLLSVVHAVMDETPNSPEEPYVYPENPLVDKKVLHSFNPNLLCVAELQDQVRHLA